MKRIYLLLFLIFVGITSIKAQDFCPGISDRNGKFIGDNEVRLKWIFSEIDPFQGVISDVITHEKAGYNNDYDVSSLHSGLGSLGFNADHDAGFMIMDEFTCYQSFWLRFYFY